VRIALARCTEPLPLLLRVSSGVPVLPCHYRQRQTGKHHASPGQRWLLIRPQLRDVGLSPGRGLRTQCGGVAGDPTVARPAQAADAGLFLDVVRGLITETRPTAAGIAVRLDSRFAEDLGLDSLALVELRSRVERRLGVVLPDDVLGAATPQEWLDAVQATGGRVQPEVVPAWKPARAAAGEAAAGLPAGAKTLLDALACSSPPLPLPYPGAGLPTHRRRAQPRRAA
jgi:acyl carrier protein